MKQKKKKRVNASVNDHTKIKRTISHAVRAAVTSNQKAEESDDEGMSDAVAVSASESETESDCNIDVIKEK